ncbi:MAG TPA: efflux RND transporter periplasmic adaptor subunit [Bacteroidales bacterium]|nr:efflux RND transporter periplasmic adaptor subunit [Bacteroidales bacterium]
MKKLISSLFTVLIIISGCSTNTLNKASSKEPDSEMHNEAIKASASDIDHTMITIKKQPFAFVVKTGGRIMVDSKDIIVITAKSSGIVKFIDHFLFPGVKISRGQQLFTISGKQLAGDNTELRFSQIKADLDQATANYERAKIMISEKIITEEHFLSLKNVYEKAMNEFNNLSGTFGKNGMSITSSENGYIREIFITEGQMVRSGQQLASIVIEHNLVLKADMSPEYMEQLPTIEKANFKVGYSNHLFKTEEMDGKKISYGKSTGENSFYIPVYFRMNYNPILIEGTFAEVYLIGKEIKDAIIVPNRALLEEYGKLYVYVEDFDGDFLKRYITPGFSNGEYTQVLSGLSENEIIVDTGAYKVKLSQMSTSAPAHNH